MQNIHDSIFSLGDRLVEIISNVTHLDNGTAQFYQKLYNASGFDSKGITIKSFIVFECTRS